MENHMINLENFYQEQLKPKSSSYEDLDVTFAAAMCFQVWETTFQIKECYRYITDKFDELQTTNKCCCGNDVSDILPRKGPIFDYNRVVILCNACGIRFKRNGKFCYSCFLIPGGKSGKMCKHIIN